MKTDISRLHNMILVGDTSKRCGKTLLLCHSMAGEIEVGDPEEVVCLGKQKRHVEMVRNMFEHVCNEHQLNIKQKRRYRWTVEDKDVFFLTNAEFERHCIGNHRLQSVHTDIIGCIASGIHDIFGMDWKEQRKHLNKRPTLGWDM